MEQDDLVFGLDIGTRTVVGFLLQVADGEFTVQASEVIEHQKRSMLDGQIHNVQEVAEQVRKIKERLEEQEDITLQKVGIAAAGRALKTVKAVEKIEFDSKKEITAEEVKVLEFGAVQTAQQKLETKETKTKASSYHFVGYTVLKNSLDGIEVGDLVGQSGTEIEVEVVATFLPRIVVDSLLTVIREADLEVEHLTLEPIAAADLIIPRQMHNFNLALVDIGAGTSDIAITSEGSIVGYAMVPVAGDEITEAICDQYMVDYHTAEQIKRQLTAQEEIEVKDILGNELTVPAREVVKKIEEEITTVAREISKGILELNQKQPQVVMCIGGGSLVPLLKDKLADSLDLPPNRVGIKDVSDIEEVTGKIDNLSGSQSVTPLGIGVNCYHNRNQANFIEVEVNGDLIHLFTLLEPKVSDALLAAEIDISALEAEPGMALTVEVEGEVKVIKGTLGTSGKIMVNGEQADLKTTIESGDELTVELGTKGEPGSGTIADVVPELPTREVKINGEWRVIEPVYYLNGEQVSWEAELEDRAEITYEVPQTVKEIIAYELELSVEEIKKKRVQYTFNGQGKEYSYNTHKIFLNGKPVDLNTEVNEHDELQVKENDQDYLQLKDIMAADMEENKLSIVFNGRELEVPAQNYKLEKNGTPVSADEYIYNGDTIEYQPGEIRINQLLDYIDYQVPTSLQGDLKIERNGEPAKLTASLDAGDEVDIYIDKPDSEPEEEKSAEEKSSLKTEEVSLKELKNKLDEEL